MKAKQFLGLSAVLFALSLTACGPQGNNPQQTDNVYYNEENFIKSSKTVTKTTVVTYDGPSILKTSDKVSVKVENRELFVYETRVNDSRKFSWETPTRKVPLVNFDFEGKVHAPTLRELGTSLGVSAETIRQTEIKALKKIRKAVDENKLELYTA